MVIQIVIKDIGQYYSHLPIVCYYDMYLIGNKRYFPSANLASSLNDIKLDKWLLDFLKENEEIFGK